MDEAEIEPGRFLQAGNDLRIVLGRHARQLHLDAVVAHRAHDRLGHAEAIDAGGDDFDRLGELLLPLGDLGAGRAPAGDLQREGHAAIQVEAKLESAFGAFLQLVQQDVVAPLDVFQRGLQPDLREELREVELALFADLLEGDEDRGGLTRGDAIAGLLHQGGELGRLGPGLGLDVLVKRPVPERD